MEGLDSLLNCQFTAFYFFQGFPCKQRRKAWGEHSPHAFFQNLLTQAQLGDNGAVTLDIGLLQVGQQVAAMTNHLQQTTTGMMVLLVNLQMFVQVVDSLGQYSDLYFGRTGVAFVGGMGQDNFGFFFFAHHNAVTSVFYLSPISRQWAGDPPYKGFFPKA